MCKLSPRFVALFLAAIFLFSVQPVISVAGEDLPKSATIPGFSGRPQKHNLSCEARSAADWATFLGTRIGENEILAALPRSDNPEVGFVGSPDGVWGLIPPRAYGVYPPALASTLQTFRIAARAVKGMNWDDVRAEIAHGRPVIVWVIGQMWTAKPIQYTANDGSKTTVAHFEHTMTVTGYTENSVQLFDAYSGTTMTFLKETFLTSWRVLGNLAIVYDPSVLQVAPPPAEPPTPTQLLAVTQVTPEAESTPQPSETPSLSPEGSQSATPTPSAVPVSQLTPTQQPGNETSAQPTVVVKSGDTLIAIAEQFNVSWQELVEFNQLAYPFFIVPGQSLRLTGNEEGRVLPDAVFLPTPTQPAPTPAAPDAPTEKAEAALTSTPAAAQQAPAEADESRVYVVQRGDFLIGLAKKFNVDWRKLATINGIGYPYFIYPGQVLKLR